MFDENRNKLTFRYILSIMPGYLFFRITVALFSLIPFPILYFISDGLYYLFFYGINYRKKIVYDNLKKSFPEKSEIEIQQISKAFYRHFCDILVEGVKGLSLSKKELLKRYRFLNPELLNTYYNEKQSIIVVGSHYANWEWGVLSASLQVKHKTIGFYMPLSNHYIDRYIKRSRAAWGMYLVSVKETTKGFEEHKKDTSVYILISDQSPSNKERAIWINFLNQETAFLHGAEKYAQLTGFPVIYVDVKRAKRGYYEVVFSVIHNKPKETIIGELTTLYAQKLENVIKANPAYWLWTHRRWKYKKKT